MMYNDFYLSYFCKSRKIFVKYVFILKYNSA